jgi:hypothetical protein
MATKRKTNITKKPGFRLGMIASGIMIILALIVLSLWFTSKSLFDRNDHFILKKVIVRSGGWWKSRSGEVSSVLKIKLGETNLFALNLADMRKLLEAEPSISKVSISRFLPDTLAVDITERIPKAFLHYKNNSLIVDNNGIVMSTESCINVDENLPVVTGFRSKKEELLPGNKLHQVAPGLKLLTLAARELPGVMFLRINQSNPKYFNCEIYLPKIKKRYTLYISHKDLEYKLEMLHSLLKKTPRTEPKAKIIDMRYEGLGVVK